MPPYAFSGWHLSALWTQLFCYVLHSWALPSLYYTHTFSTTVLSLSRPRHSWGFGVARMGHSPKARANTQRVLTECRTRRTATLLLCARNDTLAVYTNQQHSTCLPRGLAALNRPYLTFALKCIILQYAVSFPRFFLGASPKNFKMRLLGPWCLSVRPHATTRL